MANIQQAVELAALAEGKIMPAKKKTAIQIARRVFQLAAQAGHPITGIKMKEWAKKWLASDEFVLTTIATGKAALPCEPKNPNLILENMQASSHEPIVVDVNKNEIGKTPSGFTPAVIVVDGKHRHQAQVLQGHGTVEAWIGTKAVKKLSAAAIKVGNVPKVVLVPKVTKLESAAILAMGGPSGSLGSGSGANPNRMGFGAVEQDPLDEKNDPSDQSPGHGGGKRLAPSIHPHKQSPGAGVGPRADWDDGVEVPLKKDNGASKSEMQNINSDAVHIDKMYERKTGKGKK